VKLTTKLAGGSLLLVAVLSVAGYPSPNPLLFAAIKELHVSRPSLDIWDLDVQ
jgi:hypothetical protein